MQHLGKNFDFRTIKDWFLGVVQLNHTVIREVAKQEKSGPAALVLFVVGVVLPPLMMALGGVRVISATVRPDFWKVVFGVVFLLAVSVLALLVMTFVANRFFKANASFPEYFRVMGFAYGVNLVNIVGVVVPFLSVLVGLAALIWLLIIAFHALKLLFHLESTDAALTLFLGFLVYVVLSGMVAALGFSLVTGSSPISGIVLTY